MNHRIARRMERITGQGETPAKPDNISSPLQWEKMRVNPR